MGVLLNDAAPSTRHFSAAVRPVACSSERRAVIVTVSVDLGTSGNCCMSRISGATLLLASELAAPGVPPAGVLAFQFSPLSLPSAGLISSIDEPFPSALVVQIHPWCPKSVGPRRRSAQSPWVA